MSTFKHLNDIFGQFPEAIDDLIWRYAYGKTRLLMHHLTSAAKSRTYYMPVPKSWKLWTTDGKFAVKKYLNYPNLPIDMRGVFRTLEMLNWNILKAKHNNLGKWAFFNTKTSVQRALSHNETRNNSVHMVWLILCSMNITEFNAQAHKFDNFKEHCMVPTFQRPLAAYYPVDFDYHFNLNFSEYMWRYLRD